MRAEDRRFHVGDETRRQRFVMPSLDESDVEIVDGELVPRQALRGLFDDR